MGRQKKQTIVKEPIRLREQQLASGKKSLYLDIYHNGKRTYKFLKLYLLPETDTATRLANENTLKQANKIKEEMILDLTHKIAGIKDNSRKAKMAFGEWLDVYAEYVQANKRATSAIWARRLANDVRLYDPITTLADVDKEWLLGFIQYLVNRKSRTRKKENMSKATVYTFLTYLRAALNHAVHENLIPQTPLRRMTEKILSVKEHKREYLTVEEVRLLARTHSERPDIKAAFMFACFCGLRLQDVIDLKWKNITKTATHWQVEIVQYKTGIQLYLPLNMNARRWLPQDGELLPDSRVFPRLNINCSKYLAPWIQSSGITKHVTFHVARHTFATLCLTAGVDIYTTSQLLGHTTIKHTQRYARIINTKKDAAISMLDEAFAQQK